MGLASKIVSKEKGPEVPLGTLPGRQVNLSEVSQGTLVGHVCMGRR
jgi:hypothetical protein